MQVEKFSAAAGNAAELTQKNKELKTHLKEAVVALDVLAEKYKKEQKLRKQLNNELEDIKGKVRVYCRIRPFSKTELADPENRKGCVEI